MNTLALWDLREIRYIAKRVRGGCEYIFCTCKAYAYKLIGIVLIGFFDQIGTIRSDFN